MHLGSLFAALASFLQARSQKGTWLLRIDDLDIPRNIAGAADSILKTLDLFGLHWDGSVFYQSRNSDAYHQALELLEQKSLLYPCICSRQKLTQYRKTHPNSFGYPGLCRNQGLDRSIPHALRIKTNDELIIFNDTLQGKISHRMTDQDGDFIVRRRDRIIAYQLAVVIDDWNQQVTEVVRGFDLLESTPKQIFLQQMLGYDSPGYMHVPVITDLEGSKLSKQTFAKAVECKEPVKVLFELLLIMNQNPPDELKRSNLEDILSWAIKNWKSDALKNIRAISRRFY